MQLLVGGGIGAGIDETDRINNKHKVMMVENIFILKFKRFNVLPC